MNGIYRPRPRPMPNQGDVAMTDGAERRACKFCRWSSSSMYGLRCKHPSHANTASDILPSCEAFNSEGECRRWEKKRPIARFVLCAAVVVALVVFEFWRYIELVEALK